jgi:hypothetical protein
MSKTPLRTLKIFSISSKKNICAFAFKILAKFNKISHPKTFESRKFGLNKK